MLAEMLISFLVLAAAAFQVQRTARQAADPRKWTRNGLLGIATISMLIMALLIYLNSSAAFSVLGAWLPAMIAGILGERWHAGRSKVD